MKTALVVLGVAALLLIVSAAQRPLRGSTRDPQQLAGNLSAGVTFASPATYYANQHVSMIGSGDFNNDHIPDIILIDGVSSIAQVALGKGDGTFKPWINSFTLPMPSTFALGDMNNDGNLDVVLNQGGINYVGVLFGDGTGHFTSSNEFSGGPTQATGIAVADFNRDGNQDLAVGNLELQGWGNFVAVLLGTGKGNFSKWSPFAIGGKSPMSVVTGDVNGDGIPDLVVSSLVSVPHGIFSVLLGNGDGTFQAPIRTLAQYTPVNMVLADFNRDGKMDIAEANSGDVRIFLGNGDGTFSSPIVVKVGKNPSFVGAADFNGDGIPDLAVVDVNCNIACGPRGFVDILLGNGDGTFRSAASYEVGNAPGQLTIADFNGDGKPDIAVVNTEGGSMSVLINTTTPWPAGTRH